VAPAVAAEVAGVLGALLDIVGDAAAGSAAASRAEAAGGADTIAEPKAYQSGMVVNRFDQHFCDKWLRFSGFAVTM
jgi:hypothetical protein